MDDVLVHAAAGHQPEDLDLLLLSYSVRPAYGLQVVLRVPVAIEDDHSVGCLQVDTKSSSLNRDG